jgi:hypothetical protein
LFQLVPLDPDWKETDVPPPPAFNPDQLISLEMPPYMSLKFGIDPSTIKLTDDGIVRYVVVAANRDGGGFNAFYEGMRCTTAEYKSYARFGDDGTWKTISNSEWKRLGAQNSRYTQVLASQGLCRDRAPRISVEDIIRALKAPPTSVQ